MKRLEGYITLNESEVDDLNDIDASRVKDMSNLFARSQFSGDINKWDVNKSTIYELRDVFRLSLYSYTNLK